MCGYWACGESWPAIKDLQPTVPVAFRCPMFFWCVHVCMCMYMLCVCTHVCVCKTGGEVVFFLFFRFLYAIC